MGAPLSEFLFDTNVPPDFAISHTGPLPKPSVIQKSTSCPFLGSISSVLKFDRITRDPAVMGGKPCLRGMRVTVGEIVGLVASAHSTEEILRLYPYLEPKDIREALAYAA